MMKTHFKAQTWVHLKLALLNLSCLVLVGCAEFNSGWNRYSPRYDDAYSESDFEELLAFGDNLAHSPPSARAKVCRTLLKRRSGPPHPGIVLHLMVGRLLSDACGDTQRILADLRAIPPSRLDGRSQRLVAIHTEALKRMSYPSRRVTTVDCKQKSAQSASGSKGNGGSKGGENRLLREKLEAIRSMEKKMDETVDTE